MIPNICYEDYINLRELARCQAMLSYVHMTSNNMRRIEKIRNEIVEDLEKRNIRAWINEENFRWTDSVCQELTIWNARLYEVSLENQQYDSIYQKFLTQFCKEEKPAR